MSGDGALVLLVGGGTVGHLAPGFAVADALRGRGARVLFATPGESSEAAWFPDEEEPPLASPAVRLPESKLGLPAFPFRLLGAVRGARRLLAEVRPDLVLALGGWPCVPGAVAAWSRRIPLALIAADATPGVAVTRLKRLARRIYVVHDEAARVLGEDDRVRKVGPILRRATLEGRRAPEVFGLDPALRTLLVTGGSLGARALNEALVGGLVAAVRADPGLTGRVQVLHSVGKSGAGVAEAYREAGIRHHVTPFVRAMGDALATADLAVSRAGALTCAELEATGTPAVLVPYPHHADRQQYRNAERLVTSGGALLVEESDLSPERVAEEILGLLEAPDRLRTMAEAMGSQSIDGAGQIADDLIRSLQVEGS